MKALTEKERREKREAAVAKATEEYDAGNKAKALELYQQCVDVTPYMAYQLIEALKAESVRYVVAPYEADAQLAFLEINQKVSAVLTEDSDLLVFGCKKVLYKMDSVGNLTEICGSDIRKVPALKKITTPMRFRHLCILSGCDYLPSLKGVGLKKACTAIQDYGTGPQVVEKWKKWGRIIHAPPVKTGYLEAFYKADLTFQYQRVFDLASGRLVHLNEVPSDVDPETLSDFLGPFVHYVTECTNRMFISDLEPKLACAIARGEVDPISYIAFSDKDYHKKSAAVLTLRAKEIESNQQISGNAPLDRSSSS
ncbi:Rad2 nuclease [Irineochytrium annulatum]|nr:Rad2 nuclease [Irineochytrium annulatum]